MSTSTPTRRPRRWWKWAGLALLAAFALVAALPWLLTLGPIRARVASRLDRAMAPGHIRFEGLHLSWTGPTRLDRVTILDPKGESVIRADSVVLDHSLAQILFRPRSPAVLTLDGVTLEVARSDDGSLNVVEALRTVIASPDPDRDVTIRVAGGSIRYRDPFLAEPAVADSIDLTIRVPYAPGPVTWSARFARGDSSLESQGDFDAWLSRGGPPKTPELQIGVVGKRWPIVARTAGVEAAGRLDGTLDFVRKRGRWVFSGDARVDGFQTKGKTFSEDTLVFDRLEAGWDLAESDEGWKIRRLSATSPFGQVKAEGQLNGPDGSGKKRIEGTLDLAEIARQIPRALHLRDGLTVDRGSARISVDLASKPGQTSFEVEANVSDLVARDHDRPMTLKDPAILTARLVRKGDDSRVERLSIHTPFLDASANGRLEEGVAYSGTVDLGGLRKQLGEWVDLGKLDLEGRAEVSGNYAFLDSTASYRNVAKATVKDFRVEGVGPWSIRRDLSTLELDSDGPAQASGLPKGWGRLGLMVRSGKTEGHLDLEPGDGPSRWKLALASPVQVGDQPRMANLEMIGGLSTDRRTLAFDQIRAVLAPASKGSAESRMSLEALGQFDLAEGELALEPIPGHSSGGFAIDPDGLRVSGLGRGVEALRFDGGISGDLASLDHLLSDPGTRSSPGFTGRWSAVAKGRGDADGLMVTARLGLVEPPNAASTKAGRPTGLALRAHYSPSGDRLDLSEFTVSTAYGTLDASGKLEGVTGDRVVDLKGMLAPDFEAINALLSSRVEPGARVDGRPRSFRASGPIGGEGPGAWRGLDAEVGFDLLGADVYGMKFGPSPVVLRARRGALVFDPISTTLNEGHVRLEPEIDLNAPGGAVLRLAKNSSIREARINDEVSKRVLAFVAPILDQATRASGLVSVDLDHAEFPLGPGRGRQVKLEGAVVFQDVEFAPGPLAGEILGAIGRRDLTLKLDQPVTLTIADGRVNQRGMGIPLGGLARIDLNGWVDFDRNIALNATLPVTPAMLGNNALLSDLVAGTKVRLPISGTLDRPTIDKEAFAGNLQELGKSLLTRGATRGVIEILKGLGRPRDPDAPPPPPRLTPEERKALRQEKKAIRRGEIPPPSGEPRP